MLFHLNEFIREIRRDAELSKRAVEIFKKIEAEEEEKVSKLFGRKSTTSKIFRRVTNDRYVNVEYDHRNRTILVQQKKGKKLTVEELSKGTRNQLYLAIRMALGRDLLREAGFFILDEALESSDEERLPEQLETLREISEMGWQVIFLTLHRELSGALSKLTGNKPIELDRIPQAP